MRQGARNARSDDTKNLKSAICPWLQKAHPEMDALDPDSRDDRGITNDHIALILLPTEFFLAWDDEVYGHSSEHTHHQLTSTVAFGLESARATQTS